jgi:hypothetical protein
MTSSIYPPTISAGKIKIASVSDSIFADIDNSITSVNVNYSMTEASQLSFSVVEVAEKNFSRIFDYEKTFFSNLRFAERRYFDIGRDVIYETTTLRPTYLGESGGPTSPVRQQQIFEIASATIAPGSGDSPVWNINCYTKSIQQMKRDRNPSAVKGSGTEFVRRAAAKYGLKFWGENTNKKVSITKASGDKQADSLWDVIKRLAGDAKFTVFEVDGYLVFASEKYLMYKWGIDQGEPLKRKNKKTNQMETFVPKFIPLQYPGVFFGTSGYFNAMQYPTITVSENDPRFGDGSIIVDRQNGTQIRPGMTALVGNVGDLTGYYLVTSVTFDDRSPDPVTVSFRKPTKEPNEVRQLAIGRTFRSTDQDSPIGTRVSPSSSQPQDARIFPLPDSENRTNRYPRMGIANLSKSFAGFEKSSLEQGTVKATGNIDIWERPVLQSSDGPKTTYSITTNPFQESGEWRAYLLTPIWNNGSGGVVELSESAATSKFQSDGKFLALVSGTTKKNCILNARDYGKLISMQQEEVLKKRFPTYAADIGKIPTTPGSE